jgi:hypothetical protein
MRPPAAGAQRCHVVGPIWDVSLSALRLPTMTAF